MQQEILRPLAEKRKIHSKNEFELCYIRHQYFRRVKYNPTEQEMQPYSSVVRYLARRTFYTYQKLFHIVGMTFDDIVAIGNIQLVNFLGLFEITPTKNIDKYVAFIEARKKKFPVTTDEDILGKNRAVLTLFLKQRMEDLVRICRQKAKNIKGFKVEEYIPFVGPNPPPDCFYKLLEDNQAYGFKRIDNVQFKAIRKKCKAKNGKPFQWAGSWYISINVNQRSLTRDDIAGAGFDPYDNEHNLNPEQVLMRNYEENRIDKKIKMFKTSSKEEKVKTIMEFVEKNAENPGLIDEIKTARRLLKNMGL